MARGRAPRAAVVGGSIGGLTAALVLRDAGWDADVYERATRPLRDRGAGIVLHPVTVRYLVERAGADPADLGPRVSSIRYLDRGGAVASEQACGFRFASYGALYDRLLRQLDPARYHLGSELAGCAEEDGSAVACLADGTAVRADVLVGADGIHSTARAVLLPACAPRYAGYVAWRGIAPAEGAGALAEAFTFFLPPRSQILAYPIHGAGGERLVNWAWYRNVAAGGDIENLLTGLDGVRRPLSLGPGEVRPEFVGALRQAAEELLPPPLAQLVAQTREPFLQAIVDLPVPRMALGPICLIGDAAFALRPHVGAGTAKAAEDAWSLGDALADGAGDVAAALVRWEPARLALGRSLLERAREAGERSQVHGVWRVGEGPPIGLHAVGDSEFADA